MANEKHIIRLELKRAEYLEKARKLSVRIDKLLQKSKIITEGENQFASTVSGTRNEVKEIINTSSNV